MLVWAIVAILIVLIVVNGIAFLMFYWDKLCAQNRQRRIPEINLLFVALIGGSAGAIAAQQLLRHKSYKEPFRSTLWTIAAVQVAIVVTLAVSPVRKSILKPMLGPYRANCVERFIDETGGMNIVECFRRA